MTKRLILTYLIPCRLITKHTLPTTALLSPYPRLQVLFSPVAACIKRGDLAGFDAALIAGEDEFVKRRIYLTLERGRDVTLRNLLRKVFLAGGYEPLKEGQTEAERIRRTRIPINEFAAALKLGMGVDGQVLEDDEVECMIANMIYKVCPFSLTPTAYSIPEIRVHQFTSIRRRTFTRVLPSMASRCLAGCILSHLAYARLPPARQRSLALIP